MSDFAHDDRPIRKLVCRQQFYDDDSYSLEYLLPLGPREDPKSILFGFSRDFVTDAEPAAVFWDRGILNVGGLRFRVVRYTSDAYICEKVLNAFGD